MALVREIAARARGSWPNSWLHPLVRKSIFSMIGQSWGGNKAFDSTGRKDTVFNGPEWKWSKTLQRPVLDFVSANDDYVDTGFLLDHSRGFGISCWFKPDGVSGNKFIVNDRDASGTYFQLLTVDDELQYRFSADVHTTAVTALATGEWRFCYIGWDPASLQKPFYLYDSSGTLLDSDFFTQTGFTSDSNVFIGQSEAFGTGNNFDGQIADVIIWPFNLSAAQVRMLADKRWQPIQAPRQRAAFSPISAALTGTATASIDESDIVAGGKTVILTLTGDTWVNA